MRCLLAVPLFVLWVSPAFTADAPSEDTPKAAKTRMLLKQKVTFDWKDTSFGDIVDDIKMQVKGLGLRVDTKSGVNLNKQVTFKCKDIPLEDALEMLIGKNGWGFFVRSHKGDAYDGVLFIKVGKERGWEGVEGKPGKKDK